MIPRVLLATAIIFTTLQASFAFEPFQPVDFKQIHAEYEATYKDAPKFVALREKYLHARLVVYGYVLDVNPYPGGDGAYKVGVEPNSYDGHWVRPQKFDVNMKPGTYLRVSGKIVDVNQLGFVVADAACSVKDAPKEVAAAAHAVNPDPVARPQDYAVVESKDAAGQPQWSVWATYVLPDGNLCGGSRHMKSFGADRAAAEEHAKQRNAATQRIELKYALRIKK